MIHEAPKTLNIVYKKKKKKTLNIYDPSPNN